MRDAAPSSRRGEPLHTGGFAPLQSTPQAMSLYCSVDRDCLFLASNAAAQARLKAGARYERTLAAVACSRLILIEAPSSAYHGGMLVGRKVPKKRRRPQAILHYTA